MNLPFLIKIILELEKQGVKISLKDFTNEEFIKEIIRRLKDD